jgi:lipid-A-disaccharide synthase-like uncharacterized protein
MNTLYYTLSSNGTTVPDILPLFLFSCRWIVQFCTIQRQLKRNEGSIIFSFIFYITKGSILS